MSKHQKMPRPGDVDLKTNPMIGGSKAVTRAHATPDDLEGAQGVNTIEGDQANDTNPQGGIDKDVKRGRGTPHA